MANDNTEENNEQYEQEREKLRALQSKRANAANERNFVQYAVAGERMTSYFFKINAKGRPSREIRKLRVGQDEIEGQEVAEYFYQKFSEMAKRDENVGTSTLFERNSFRGATAVFRVPLPSSFLQIVVS